MRYERVKEGEVIPVMQGEVSPDGYEVISQEYSSEAVIIYIQW